MHGLKAESKYFQSLLIYNLFKSLPNLQSLSFTKSNEYDDNNYYDSLSITQINGVDIECNGYIRDENGQVFDYDDEMVENSKLIDEDLIEYIADILDEATGNNYDYGDHVLHRQDQCEKSKVCNKAFISYYQCLISGSKLDDESLFDNHPEIALLYAYDILKGRLNKNTEKYLKTDFFLCYLYAKHVIKGKLPKEIENHFSLKSFNKLTDQEKKYFALYKEFLNDVAQKV